MPQIADMTLLNGSTTPISKTFSATYRDSSKSVFTLLEGRGDLRPKVTLTVRLPSKGLNQKVTAVTVVPFEGTVDGETRVLYASKRSEWSFPANTPESVILDVIAFGISADQDTQVVLACTDGLAPL